MCIAPTPPTAPFNKPEPFCMFKYRLARGQPTCSEREINAYISAVKDHEREVQAYAQYVKDFAHQADQYAKCEAKEATEAQRLATERPFRLGHN